LVIGDIVLLCYCVVVGVGIVVGNLLLNLVVDIVGSCYCCCIVGIVIILLLTIDD